MTAVDRTSTARELAEQSAEVERVAARADAERVAWTASDHFDVADERAAAAGSVATTNPNLAERLETIAEQAHDGDGPTRHPCC